MTSTRILAMQTGGWIGDMVLLAPALRNLRRQWPEADITLMVRPHVAPLMRTLPDLDRVLVYDKRGDQRGWRALVRLARGLEDIDLAFVWHPNSIRSALIPWLARIPVRIGSRANGRGVFLTHSYPDRTDLHEVERYLLALTRIGCPITERRLFFWHTEHHRERIARWMAEHKLDAARPILAIHLGTTWPTKRWFVDRFAEVANTIRGDRDVQIVLVGGPGERRLVSEFNRHVHVPYVDAVGELDLLTFGALLERCQVLLTCDSGPMHIAASVGTSTVALFGPTDPIRHRPYGEGHHVVKRALPCSPCYRRTCPIGHECMRQIQVAEVVEATAEALRSVRLNGRGHVGRRASG